MMESPESRAFPGKAKRKDDTTGMNRAEAAWNLVKNDRVSEAGKAHGLDRVQDAAVKGYDTISNVVPAVLSPLSNNQFEVVQRTNPIAGTIEGVRSTLKARWFPRGNPLNIIPKGIEAVTGLTDGLVHDVLHLGGSGNGYVIRTTD
jgi:hypothetical protein